MFWRELGYLLPPTAAERPFVDDKKHLSKRKRGAPNVRANELVPVLPAPVETFLENESPSEGQESGSSEYYEELSTFSPFQLLPDEVLIFIFKKLSIYDLCQTIPRVSKHWHSIADDNQLWKELYLWRWKSMPKRLQRIMALTSPHTPNFSAPRWIHPFDSCSIRYSTSQSRSDSSPITTSSSTQDSETETTGNPIPPAKTHKDTTLSWHLHEVCYHDSEDYSGDDSGDELTAGSDFLLLDPFITTRSESLSSESCLSLAENEEMFSAGSPTLSRLQESVMAEDEEEIETDADLADDEAEDFRNQSRKKKYKKRSSEEEQRGFTQTYSSSPRAVLRAPSPSSDSSPSSSEIDETTDDYPSDSSVELQWRQQYLRRMEVDKNWQSVRYVLSTLKGHSLAVMCVKCSTPSSSSLMVKDEKDAGVIVSCSLDKSIKLWDLKQGKCLRTFTGHKDWVNYVDFQYLPTASSSSSSSHSNGEANRKRLVSCGYDASVRVWNAENGTCVRTLYGHQNIVWAAQMICSMITSCSSDSTVRVWDAEQGKCTRTMTGHRSVVYCMGVDPAQGKGGNVIVSGSMDKTIKVWDVRVGSAVMTLSGHTERLCCLQYDAEQGLIVSGSRDSTVRIWELRKKAGGTWGSGENTGTLRGHQGRVCCLQFDEEKIVTGSDDNTVKVWSMEKARSSAENALVNTLADHDCWVNSLWFDEERLVSGAADDTIKVWDFLDVGDKAKRSKRSRLRQDSVCIVS